MKVRRSSRIVILDKYDRVLLFEIDDNRVFDPGWPGSHRFWVLTGGGIEQGETHEQAALRELWEETGLRAATLGPCIWTREKIVQYDGAELLGREWYYLLRVDSINVSDANWLPQERDLIRSHRWWSLSDLASTTEAVFPERLAVLLAPILAGDIPSEPIDISLR